MSNFVPGRPGYATESEAGSMYELRQYPSYYSSAVSTSAFGSHKSLLSLYTPSQASTFLPVTQNAPDPTRRPRDNFGFALFSLFINPIFGLVAILLAQVSKDYFNRCKYIKASKFGAYAKGTAAGGIASTFILIFMAVGQAIVNHYKFDY
ncbi:hypothetical protein FSP39_004475 [Pinctada imbricata]|uniref:Uncharacterized protein n=1 Tax=Pinctada imbricata TaxID=66713 RepID=A0AA88YS08_PINIB|nr:hypothetical protein FSP39_004475 [Pinctada imbricata]